MIGFNFVDSKLKKKYVVENHGCKEILKDSLTEYRTINGEH